MLLLPLKLILLFPRCSRGSLSCTKYFDFLYSNVINKWLCEALLALTHFDCHAFDGDSKSSLLLVQDL